METRNFASRLDKGSSIKKTFASLTIAEEVYAHPANTFVATFIGAPAMNLVECDYNDGRLIFENGFEIALFKSNTSPKSLLSGICLVTLHFAIISCPPSCI